MRVFFFHGRESGPRGAKYRALVDAGFEVVSPDFTGMETAAERLALAEQVTDGMTGITLVGSSMGGLVAALLANKHPERVGKLFLLAPAVHWMEAKSITKLPADTLVFKAMDDTIIPETALEDFIEKHNLWCIPLGDDHRLSHPSSLNQLVKRVARTPSV